VSLDVPRGSITGLIGPDGAGKTTLMRLTAGLLKPDAGQLDVLGIDASREPLKVQASLGYMPQRFGLYEDLSVGENLDLYADLQGVPAELRPARYRELMEMTGLAPFMKRLAGRLSGGMKQKLGLACTLINPPRLLLLDEPTVGVDPVSRRELWEIVYRLVREEGMSVLLSTAYLDEAERCDHVVLLHEGEVLGSGTPAELSAPLDGRTFTVSAPDTSRRALQRKLRQQTFVTDALILGDSVRVVTDTGGWREPEPPLPEDAHVEAVPPRFEDSFIARLSSSEPAAAPVSEPDTPVAGGHETVISVSGLDRRFGDFYAVRDLEFEVKRGEIFGLLGANGAGKTTTFRMLCGLLPPSAGELRVAGVDLGHAAARARARIGYMSQKFSLYGNLSVAQNLKFFASVYGLDRTRRAERIAWALDEFELAGVADMDSIELPLGYKQRLALAAALMHEPEILFLDEPTSGVDPLARREFWTRITALADHGVAVLVTTHFMEEAEYCDRLAIMAAGRILDTGTPAEIKAGASGENPTMEDAFIELIQSAPAAEAA
jgi:ABC-2 type transport system ATP-binding protein